MQQRAADACHPTIMEAVDREADVDGPRIIDLMKPRLGSSGVMDGDRSGSGSVNNFKRGRVRAEESRAEVVVALQAEVHRHNRVVAW
jgi:hypothetical protein